MARRISLQIHFLSIPRKLGQVHLQIFIWVISTRHLAHCKAGSRQRGWKIPALRVSRILAVVVDVAVFLPWLQRYGSAPPHLFSTASRCFCVCKRRFSVAPDVELTCIAACVDPPCRRRAYAGPSLWDGPCSALGCVCSDFDWWIARFWHTRTRTIPVR
jgi:hypothetical protein